VSVLPTYWVLLARRRRGGRSVTVAAADFFVSYAGADQAWAEWIAGQLEDAGYTTLLQAWDFRPGSDFLHQMQQATSTAQRTVAVLSPAYFGSRFGETEWRAAFAKDPTEELGLLVCRRRSPTDPDRPVSHRRGLQGPWPNASRCPSTPLSHYRRCSHGRT
jgi:hypothetical protein